MIFPVVIYVCDSGTIKKAEHHIQVKSCLSFCVWIISFFRRFFRFIHVAANGKAFFFLRLNNIPLCVYIYISHIYTYHTYKYRSYISYTYVHIYTIKKQLLLERKAITNLDSILKGRDITLPTKVRLVKVIVFPVVMNGCESQTSFL